MRQISHVNVAKDEVKDRGLAKSRGSHEGAYDVQRLFDSNQNRARLWMLNYPSRRGLARGCNIVVRICDNRGFPERGVHGGWTCNGTLGNQRQIGPIARTPLSTPETPRPKPRAGNASRRGLEFVAAAAAAAQDPRSRQGRPRDAGGPPSASCFAGQVRCLWHTGTHAQPADRPV
jgi:hypothetical protein